MKKTTLILWIVAAVIAVSSVPLFVQGNIGAGVCGLVIAAVLGLIGWQKMQTAEAHGRQSDTFTPPSDEGTYKVYIETDGKKYHSDKACSGMRNPKYVPLAYALKKGYTECKKCSRLK